MTSVSDMLDISQDSRMRLDVIIPTYNRHQLLKRTLSSLLAAESPPGLDVRVTVVDNNSRDETRSVVESHKERFQGRLNYVFESKQGRSHALNAGIMSTGGQLVGMIDNDEEIDKEWYASIYSAFTEYDIDFIGGPYVPRWGAECPAWLPGGHLGAIGWVDGGQEIVPFDKSYPGILMGGNAVLTRAILDKVGLYNTSLGRTDKRLISGEDDDMYQRLLAAGARGYYIPNLIIYHYIPPERLTRTYFRSWCFWRGVSCSLIDRERPMPVAYLGKVPRFLYGQLARGMVNVISGLIGRRKSASQVFTEELAMWDAAGFIYGRHFYKPGGSVEPDGQKIVARVPI